MVTISILPLIENKVTDARNLYRNLQVERSRHLTTMDIFL